MSENEVKVFKVVQRLGANGKPINIKIEEGLTGAGCTFDAGYIDPESLPKHGYPNHTGKAIFQRLLNIR
ncbi:MAG: hypothetical protein Q8P80_01405 [Candidatus Levybacteria bacterium]|nr:hypothetical protein [Candidatus Levybacteria bacterium]